MNDRIDALKAERMARVEKKHGTLDLWSDPWDFVQEGIEGLVDFLNYIEFAMLQSRLAFYKWAPIDKDIRFIIWKLSRVSNGRD